jgi:hypothetical protein
MWRYALVGSGAVIGATLVVEWGGLDPGNVVRALSGLPAGAVVGSLVTALLTGGLS